MLPAMAAWRVAAQSTMDTITHMFGVQFDGVAQTDMQVFPQIVDAVGGVDIVNPYEFYDDVYHNRGFPAGAIHLTGADAIVFCRIRVPDGDGGRRDRADAAVELLRPHR